MNPRKNHWWYITFYVNSRGITTFTIPYESGLHKFEFQFNFIKHQVELTTSKGEFFELTLEDGLSVADFFNKLMNFLHKIGIEVDINNKPYDMPIKKPFDKIDEYHHYDRVAIEKFWQINRWVDHVFREFSGRFYGKTCPVHIYWHSFDIAVTRFSGKKAPTMAKDARLSDKDAYSHENISFGFWFGDDNLPEPAFYSYTYPAPEGINQQQLEPGDAFWAEQHGSPMALLKYHDLIKHDDPKQRLLQFMESAYQAGAKLANWPVEELKVPELDEL